MTNLEFALLKLKASSKLMKEFILEDAPNSLSFQAISNYVSEHIEGLHQALEQLEKETQP